MDEDYIDIVRKSLYTTSHKNSSDVVQETTRKPKKIKFALDSYKSENVFTDNKPKSEKILKRKSTPLKSSTDLKRKKKTEKSSFKTDSNIRKMGQKSTPFRETKSKKKKLVISYSSNSNGNVIDSLTPSKSEVEGFPIFSTSKYNTKPDLSDEASNESDGSAKNFNLDSFFNTRELSFNESITEAHSGIDYEFISDCFDEVKIHENKSLSNGINKFVTDEDFSTLDSENTELGDVSTKIAHVEKRDILNDSENSEQILEGNLISDANLNKMNDDEPVATTVSDTSSFSEDVVEDNLQVNASNMNCAVNTDTKTNNFVRGSLNLFEYYDLDHSKLVILKKNCSISVHGFFTLKVLYGKLEVLGSILDATSNEIDLYSPRGSALLCLKNVDIIEREDKGLSEILPNLKDNEIVKGKMIEKSSTVLECTKLEDVKIPFTEKFIAQQIFPFTNNDKLPRVIFEPKDNWNVIREDDSWGNIVDIVQPSSKLLLLGGKGVGKSTFLRYAINRLLHKYPKVRVIDLDPGQSEFAVPGCVSIVTISEPVFGPNYTHLKRTDRSLLSNINVGQQPDKYIKCVKFLMKYFDTLEKIPTLINYMGFVQRIGVNIVASAITFIQPTDIVEIVSKNPVKNFKSGLSFETIQENCNLFESNPVTLEYNLHTLAAMNDENDGWALEPRQVREMCTLAYLGQMMSRNVISLASHKLPIYKITLSSLKIVNIDMEEVSMAAVNANFVALCFLDEFTVLNCLGYGVVRGIDLECETLQLITPEPLSVLEDVSYLVVGSVTLPPSIYMTPDDITGNIPYVMEGELVSLGQITKRSYLPANKK